LVSLFGQFVDELELNKFSIAGNSLGGYIGATYAAQYPERVSKLILLDPVGYPQATPWVFDVAISPGISTMGRFVSPPLLVTLNVKEVYGDPSRLTQANLERYIHMAQRNGAKSAYMDTLITLKSRSTSQVPLPFFNIKAPTLLMWGESDRWVPVELTKRWQADISNLKLITYPGVGHMPMEEIPEQTVQDAIAFLGDLARRPQAASQPTAPARDFNELESLLRGGTSADQPAGATLDEMAPLEL
jgi:pimeloyl-ACP methyl ester carboxylesterase